MAVSPSTSMVANPRRYCSMTAAICCLSCSRAAIALSPRCNPPDTIASHLCPVKLHVRYDPLSPISSSERCTSSVGIAHVTRPSEPPNAIKLSHTRAIGWRACSATALLLIRASTRVHGSAFPGSEEFLRLFRRMQIRKTSHLASDFLQSLLQGAVFQGP